MGPKRPFSEECVTELLDLSQTESWTNLEDYRRSEAKYDGARGSHLGTAESGVILTKSWRFLFRLPEQAQEDL